MLKRFEVENYRGFKTKLIWDFSQTRDYEYNTSLVSNHISKHSVLYGKNGSGKTSLSYALLDLTNHLIDKQKILIPEQFYTYVGNESKIATFTYEFLLDNNNITYSYQKNNYGDLLMESLFLNKKEIVHHDFCDESTNFIKIKEAKTLRTTGLPKQLSVIKFIFNNTILSHDSPIVLLMNFVSGMLSFRSMRQINEYVGYKLGGEPLEDIIIRNNKIKEFNEFLRKCGLNYTLEKAVHPNGRQIIAVKFENGILVPITEIASSGTNTLMLYYCWLLDFKNITFVVIDEFDAYYHYEVSEMLLKIINSYDNLQSVVSTHNITLLSTQETRPDCAYILDENGVVNLSIDNHSIKVIVKIVPRRRLIR